MDKSLCLDNIARVMEHAAKLDSFVRIDMEDHECTDITLDIYRQLREQFSNVGTVLQSMLHRTEDDARELLPSATNIRLCKGIYREPPEIAYQDPEEVRDSYRRILNVLLEGGAYVGIATHDEALTETSVQTVERLGLAREQYEFQMLLGVRESLRQDLISRGHRLRVYVPFGADWYAYSVRRLRENPSVAKHVVTAFINGE
jgi:proline dehydrogenase